jgi:hypothetical protein
MANAWDRYVHLDLHIAMCTDVLKHQVICNKYVQFYVSVKINLNEI